MSELPFTVAEIEHAPFLDSNDSLRRLGAGEPLCPWCGRALTEPEYVDVEV